eukprot:gnl/MRDRNA2_/MRDRNA2_100661_c0_seq1.p1 gnl/MRDRNA2_/MRDRNA2_100661_c0~~gnl/MRDRNA2_/MRDRNA2_100661_c0_seq1.p1  ORF type:complete len:653 (-),score=127.74 gnl/MRDRNA2_/MRDRNA2_100661_c0_seq1:93-1985(-)
MPTSSAGPRVPPHIAAAGSELVVFSREPRRRAVAAARRVPPAYSVLSYDIGCVNCGDDAITLCPDCVSCQVNAAKSFGSSQLLTSPSFRSEISRASSSVQAYSVASESSSATTPGVSSQRHEGQPSKAKKVSAQLQTKKSRGKVLWPPSGITGFANFKQLFQAASSKKAAEMEADFVSPLQTVDRGIQGSHRKWVQDASEMAQHKLARRDTMSSTTSSSEEEVDELTAPIRGTWRDCSAVLKLRHNFDPMPLSPRTPLSPKSHGDMPLTANAVHTKTEAITMEAAQVASRSREIRKTGNVHTRERHDDIIKLRKQIAVSMQTTFDRDVITCCALIPEDLEDGPEAREKAIKAMAREREKQEIASKIADGFEECRHWNDVMDNRKQSVHPRKTIGAGSQKLSQSDKRDMWDRRELAIRALGKQTNTSVLDVEAAHDTFDHYAIDSAMQIGPTLRALLADLRPGDSRIDDAVRDLEAKALGKNGDEGDRLIQFPEFYIWLVNRFPVEKVEEEQQGEQKKDKAAPQEENCVSRSMALRRSKAAKLATLRGEARATVSEGSSFGSMESRSGSEVISAENLPSSKGRISISKARTSATLGQSPSPFGKHNSSPNKEAGSMPVPRGFTKAKTRASV